MPYYENGRNLTIDFHGLAADPGQFEIVAYNDTPLPGNNTYFKKTHMPYNTNLFYDPVPFDMLKTFESKPQVLVEIGGLPAVCHNLTCDYTFTEAKGLVTAFTFDLTSKALKLTGTDLPVNLTEITSIDFAHTSCTINKATLTATNIDCILDRAPVCG